MQLVIFFLIVISYSSFAYANLENVQGGATLSCETIDGRPLQHGQRFIAYKNEFAPSGGVCNDIMEERECVNGVISGSFTHEFCLEKKSCETDGQIIEHGMNFKLYKESIATQATDCESQVRTCTNGILDGEDEYTYTSCQTQKEKSDQIARAYKKLYDVAKKNGNYKLLNQPVFKNYQRELRTKLLEAAKEK